MRITVSRWALAVVAGLIVCMLAAGSAVASDSRCPAITFHLHYGGGNYTLEQTPPLAGPAHYVDAPALSRAAGNPWREIEQWEGYIGSVNPGGCSSIFEIGPVHTWLGLRNTDDQGTSFDLKADVWFQPNAPGPATVLLASFERLCISGLARNPALASEIVLGALQTVPPTLGDGEVVLRLSARIGTPQAKCAGHPSASGLRVYFDAPDRDSYFQLFLD